MKIRSVFLLACVCTSLAMGAGPAHWVVTWGASPAPQLPSDEQMRAAKLEFADQTLREIVHTSMGSNMARVRLSNAFGKQTVEIGAAHIALRGQGAGIVAGSDRVLTFSGRAAVSIPPNALALSDPVKLDVPASGDLAISVYIPAPVTGAGIHYAAQ